MWTHRPARRRALFALLCFGGAALLAPGANPGAQAAPAAFFLKHQRQVSYPFDQVWPTAVRYLRVERGYEIADRDKDSGYIVFTFEHGSNKANGSVEFLSDLDDEGRKSVTMISSTSRGPSHLPFAILDGIATKLREERGQPARPPSPPAAPPPTEEVPDEDKTHDGGSSLPG
jgi:hypothetical protein